MEDHAQGQSGWEQATELRETGVRSRLRGLFAPTDAGDAVADLIAVHGRELERRSETLLTAVHDLERREEAVGARAIELERQAKELTALAARLEGLGAGVRETTEVPADRSHVVLTAGYRLLEVDGPAPSPGDVVELDGGSYRCLRVTTSPLPGDRRRCALLERSHQSEH